MESAAGQEIPVKELVFEEVFPDENPHTLDQIMDRVQGIHPNWPLDDVLSEAQRILQAVKPDV